MIIGICGFQSSGKDTIANYLVKNHNFIKLSFASATKDVVSCLFSLDRNMLEGNTPECRKKREEVDSWWSNRLGIPNLTPRKMLQLIGTDVFRNNFHKEIWISILEKKLLFNLHSNIVISDCRFSNEINILKKYNAKIIHVYRNLPNWFIPYKNNETIDSEEFNKIHSSELDWIKSDFDYDINNNSTIQNLYLIIDNITKI